MKYMINRAFGLRGVLTLLALMLAFAAAMIFFFGRKKKLFGE